MAVRSLEKLRHPAVRDFLIILAFLALTIVMTWPWILHLRTATPGPGDPYLISWILWWDYHQTFHSPLNLFHANIFYPYRYTLAFTEHHYAIAVLCFPFFAMGLQPLTVQGIATLLGFALSGYCAFRLARTLTGSNSVAWIAGIVFGFIPYRFSQLPHLVYLWAASIPLLLEALVLFLRAQTRRRAVWLGFTFFLNGISSVHWLLMTLIPLALSALLFLFRNQGWRPRDLWRRGLVAMASAGVALLPFLWPYYRVSKLYGFVRNAEEAAFYSAKPIDWLVGINGNQMWHMMNDYARAPERELFPGFLPILLAVAAIFLIKPSPADEPRKKFGRIVLVLDLLTILFGVLVVMVSGLGNITLASFGYRPISISHVSPLIVAFVAVLGVRLSLAYPQVLKRLPKRNFLTSLPAERRSDAFWLAVIWTVLGFAGSLGMNFFFHRLLFQYITIFRSIRVPARWAMICYLGLALLAGLGAKQLLDLISRHYKKFPATVAYVVLAGAILFEQNAAPIGLFTGATNPDLLTLRLKQMSMRGGIAELPFGVNEPMDFVYVLRAADHGRPLITAISGFMPPIPAEIDSLTHNLPVSDKLIDLLERIPCSYLVIHNDQFEPSARATLESVLGTGLTSGRLRFIRSYEESDLYAVTRTEPEAKSEAPPPAQVLMAAGRELILPGDASATGKHNSIDDPEFFIRMQYLDFLGREPDRGGLNFWVSQITKCGADAVCIDKQRARVSAAFFEATEFQQTGFLVYLAYRATLGRKPTYAEFMSDRAKLSTGTAFASGQVKFLEEWTARPEFMHLYPSRLPADQFVDALIKTVGSSTGVNLEQKREPLLSLSTRGNRAAVIRDIVEDQTLSLAEQKEALVLMQYFAYLKRDPDPLTYEFWIDALGKNAPNAVINMVRTFINSTEYRERFTGGNPPVPAKQLPP